MKAIDANLPSQSCDSCSIDKKMKFKNYLNHNKTLFFSPIKKVMYCAKKFISRHWNLLAAEARLIKFSDVY